MCRLSFFKHILWLGLVASTGWVNAGNPLVPGKGISDPHITIHEGRAYLFAGHDPGLNEWWVWSSADLVNWNHESTLLPETMFMGIKETSCWASFGAFRNNQCYWYVSAGANEIGVLVADTPAGPWKDILGKPLIPVGMVPTDERDPDILIDDDGKAYMVFGTFNYYIVRLNEDMISLAEKPRLVELDRKFGPAGEGRTDDKPSLHKRNGIYYLSWCSFYATSPNLYGPYTYKGTVIDPEQVAPQFRIQNERIWLDRHGNFFSWNNQWFYVFHDLSMPNGRQACISYVHYRNNGDIAPIRLDPIGVGQYDVGQPWIQAEDYFKSVDITTGECPAGGFEVQKIREGSCLVYPRVMNLRKDIPMTFMISSTNPAGGTIEVRETGSSGKLLGTCRVSDTGGWDQYREFGCSLQTEPGTKDLCLVFRGSSDEVMRLNKIAFKQAANPVGSITESH